MANPFFVTGKRLVQLAQEAEAGGDIAAVLLGGAKEELEKRWAASAVRLKNGEWCVVPVKEPVVLRGGAQVRLADSGTLGGRVMLRDAAWLKDNVDKVYLGALKLPDGEGGRCASGASNGTTLSVFFNTIYHSLKRKSISEPSLLGLVIDNEQESV